MFLHTTYLFAVYTVCLYVYLYCTALHYSCTTSTNILSFHSFSTIGAIKAEKEKDAKYVPFFYSIILQLIDRTPYIYDKHTNLPPLQQHTLFSNTHPNEQKLFQEWSELYLNDQNDIPHYLADHLKNKVVPGTLLDATLFYCILDKEYIHTLSEDKKKEIKQRIWHVGSTIKIIHNCIWSNNRYCNTMINCLRTCFRCLYYLNTELMRGQINFPDVSAAAG